MNNTVVSLSLQNHQKNLIIASINPMVFNHMKITQVYSQTHDFHVGTLILKMMNTILKNQRMNSLFIPLIPMIHYGLINMIFKVMMLVSIP